MKNILKNITDLKRSIPNCFYLIQWTKATALIVIFLLSIHQLSAQKISATISRDKISIGEQFELKLKVEPTSNNALLIDKWFAILDTFNTFLVVKRQPIDTLRIASTQGYQQIITLTSFDSGSHELLGFPIEFKNQLTLKTKPLTIIVKSVNLSNVQDYHDIKDIIEEEEPAATNWQFIVIVALSILILLWIMNIIIKKIKGKRKNPIAKHEVKSMKTILQELDSLERFIADKNYQLLYTELSTICKNYLGNYLHFSQSNTTAEFLTILSNHFSENHPIYQEFKEMLLQADAIKFAKSIPTDTTCHSSIKMAKELIIALTNYFNKPTADVI